MSNSAWSNGEHIDGMFQYMQVNSERVWSMLQRLEPALGADTARGLLTRFVDRSLAEVPVLPRTGATPTHGSAGQEASVGPNDREFPAPAEASNIRGGVPADREALASLPKFRPEATTPTRTGTRLPPRTQPSTSVPVQEHQPSKSGGHDHEWLRPVVDEREWESYKALKTDILDFGEKWRYLHRSSAAKVRLAGAFISSNGLYASLNNGRVWRASCAVEGLRLPESCRMRSETTSRSNVIWKVGH